MAQFAYRQIYTQIWRDDWFQELEPEAKLLFIYLFSNDSSNLLGLYKISLRTIAFETGLEIDYIKSTIQYFSEHGKVHYQDGYIWVVNLLRYNFNRSDKTVIHIKNELARIPDTQLKIDYINSANTVLIPYGYSIDGVLSVTRQDKTETVTETGQNQNQAPAAAASFAPSIPAESDLLNHWTMATGMIAIPGNSEKAYRLLNSLYGVHRGALAEYLRPYFTEWKARDYNPSNIDWLDWAVGGKIPERKTQPRNGNKPGVDATIAELEKRRANNR